MLVKGGPAIIGDSHNTREVAAPDKVLGPIQHIWELVCQMKDIKVMLTCQFKGTRYIL